jgi:hypothetical protein
MKVHEIHTGLERIHQRFEDPRIGKVHHKQVCY